MDLRPDLPPAGPVDLPGRGRTWVYDSGERDGRPAVLLLHGWTSSAALNWYRCFPSLSARYRVVALDHRGHGRGIRSRRPFSLQDCADDAAALVATLGLDRVIAVGYSMGGPVALHLWRRHPGTVRSLVLCATAATFGPMPKWSGPRGDVMHAIAVGLGLTPRCLRRLGMTYVARQFAEPGTARWAADEWGRHDPVALMQGGMALARYDVTSWLPQLDVPTGVILTELDTTVPPHRQRALADAIPGAVTFPVAGAHRACADDAELFVPALLAALDSVDARWNEMHRTGDAATEPRAAGVAPAPTGVAPAPTAVTRRRR